MHKLVIKSAAPESYRVVTTTTKSKGKCSSVGCYAMYNPKDGINSMFAYIKAEEGDSIFWPLLLPHLERTGDFKRYADHEAAAIAAKEREHKEIVAQIEACDAAIARQQAKLLKVDEDALIAAINEEVHQQREEKLRLQSRLEIFLVGDTKYAKQMIAWSELLADVNDWPDLVARSTIEERQRFALIFAPV